MKAKSKGSKKPVAVQAPPEQAKPAQSRPKLPKLDYPSGSMIEEILRFFGSSEAPSLIDYEDMSRRAYRRADALLDIFELAGYGLEGTHTLAGDVFGYTVDSIRMQIEIGRAVAEALYKHCQVVAPADSHESQ